MASARISTSTVLLLLFLKVLPPWADTWSDGAWLHKLTNFGKEWKQFDVTDPNAFVYASYDCTESQWFLAREEQWINSSIDLKLYESYNFFLSLEEQLINSSIDLELYDSYSIPGNIKARCKKDYSQWALASALPLVACLLFTLLVWWREEEGWTKVLLLPVVFVGLYSQYRAVRIILIGLGKWPNKKMEDWQEEKGKFTRETVSIEPVTEAVPTGLIQVVLLTTELPAIFSGNRPNPLGDNPVFFGFNIGLSCLLSVMGLSHFLKDGPSPLISSNGYLDGFLSKEFSALFSATFLWGAVKCLTLSCCVYSHLLGVQSIAGIDLQRSVHVATVSWVATMVLPQLIHPITVLAMTTGWKLFSLILSFPSFFITPVFTPFTYKGSCKNGKYEFRVSIKHTIINIFLTFLFTPLSMALNYYEDIWENTYNFGLTTREISSVKASIKSAQDDKNLIKANKLEARIDLATNYRQYIVIMFVIIPYILLFLSLLPPSCSSGTASVETTGQKNTETTSTSGKLEHSDGKLNQRKMTVKRWWWF